MHSLTLVFAAAIAFCLSTLGEGVLGRRSSTLADWNIAFLVGLSLTSTLFFPLSWMLHGYALNITAGGLLLTGVWGAILRCIDAGRRWKRGEFSAPRIAVRGFFPNALLMLLLLLIVQFTLENERIMYYWDGYQIWATKAMLLYDRGSLTRTLILPNDPQLLSFPACCDMTMRVAAYPQMLPLYEALVAKFQGYFTWEAFKAVFPFFFVSMLISTFQAARAFVPQTLALASCLLLALFPAVSSGLALGGYADMPQAALFAGLLAALFTSGDADGPSYRRATPWLLGGVLLVKSEGGILCTIACAMILIDWASRGRENFLAALKRRAGAIAVVGTCAVLRRLYVAWMVTKDKTYGPFDQAHLAVASQRILSVPEACAHFLLDTGVWGIFWPLFFVALPLVVWKGERRERGLACGALVSLAAYTSIFYFTNWDVNFHLGAAYNRLLVQLTPAAVLVTALGYKILAPGKLPVPVLETPAPEAAGVTLVLPNMPMQGSQPQTNLVAGPGRIRRVIAASAAAVVMGCSLYVGVVDSLHENKVVFHDAPPNALPPGHVAQVEMVRKLVPKGSVVIYFMPQPETWRFGLWKRSLFPDYILLPVAGSKVLDSPPVLAFRKRHRVQYAILVGTSLPEATDVVALPEYPPRTTTALARLGD